MTLRTLLPLLCALLILSGCAQRTVHVDPKPDRTWPDIDGVKPGMRGYWAKAAPFYRARERDSASRADTAEENNATEKRMALQNKLYWGSGICIAAAVLLFGLWVASRFVAFLRPAGPWFLAIAIGAAGVAVACIGVAWVLAHIWWFVAALAVLVALAGFYQWAKAAGLFHKLSNGLEKIKPDLDAGAPGWRDKLKGELGEKGHQAMRKVRTRLGHSVDGKQE